MLDAFGLPIIVFKESIIYILCTSAVVGLNAWAIYDVSMEHKKGSLKLVNLFGSREDRIRTCDPPALKQDILPRLN